jgi:hypothetical protein
MECMNGGVTDLSQHCFGYLHVMERWQTELRWQCCPVG